MGARASLTPMLPPYRPPRFVPGGASAREGQPRPTRSPTSEADRDDVRDARARELEQEFEEALGTEPLEQGGGGTKRGRDWEDLDDVRAAPFLSAAAADPQVAASVRALQALAARAPRGPVPEPARLPPPLFDRGLREVATGVEDPPDGDYAAGPNIRLTLLSSGSSTVVVSGQRHDVPGCLVGMLALLVANHDRVVSLDDLCRLTGASGETLGRHVRRLRKELGLTIHCDRVQGTHHLAAGYRLDTLGVTQGTVAAELAPLQRRSRQRPAHQAQAGAGALSSSASSLPSGTGSPNR